MRKIFLDNISENVILTGENHAHLSVVLRAKKDDLVMLSCQDGYDYTAKIIDFKRNETHLKVIRKEKNCTEPSIDVSLFFGILKGDKNELVVQKAVELGVKNIFPIVTSRSVSSAVNSARLNKIALEAAKQSGRDIVPTVHNLIDFKTLLTHLNEYKTVVFAYENSDGADIKTHLESTADFSKTAIIIGAEGGFTETEASMLTECSVTPLSLGKRILRAETACISVLTLVMYAAGQLK